MPSPSEPADRRTMYARIACATHLPTPRLTNFIDEARIVLLSLDTLAEGQQWAAAHDIPVDPHVVEGRRYLGASPGEWHGWQLRLHADEPAELAARP